MKKSALERLKELDNKSVKFHDANQKLLDEGYSEEEILNGLYQFSYDGKPNKPKLPRKIEEYYKSNPEAAKEMADFLLTHQANEDRYERVSEAAANYAASRFAPGHHAKSHYSLKFADNIGFPFYTSLLVGMITFFVVLANRWPSYLLYVVTLGYVALFYLFKFLTK